MTTSGQRPDILALIQDIHNNLDQDHYPLSRVVPKVIRVATLLGDDGAVARYTLETMDSPEAKDIDAMLRKISNNFDPSIAKTIRDAVTKDWFNERMASMTNLGKSQEEHVVNTQSVSRLEILKREMAKAYDHSCSRENSEWMIYHAKEWQKQDFYREQNSYYSAVRDVEMIMDRLRTNIVSYLATAETRALTAINAAQQAQEAGGVTAVAPIVDKRKVFVVYGQDEALRSAVFSFLRAAGLDPLEWNELVQLTSEAKGTATPYVGDIIEVGMSQAQAVVVVFTGDEEAILRADLVKPGSPPPKAELQPRPNVILEAGMALLKYPERTILVEVGKVRQMSDVVGRYVLRLTNDFLKRKEFMDRLHTAGCAVNYARNDWTSEGKLPDA